MHGVQQHSGLQLSEAATLAIHACSLIAMKSPERVTGAQLAAWTQASQHHLSKVLAQLVKAGIIEGTRGVNGGFVLAKQPKEVSFLQIYETIEGPLAPPTCPCQRGYCKLRGCLFDGFLGRIQREFREFFEKKTLGEVI